MAMTAATTARIESVDVLEIQASGTRAPSVTTQTYTNYHKQKAQRKRKVGTSEERMRKV